MKAVWSSLLSTALVALWTVYPANASVIYQSVPNLTANMAASSLCSSCSGQDQVFDPFGLSATEIIGQIQFDAYNNHLYFHIDVSVEIFNYNGAGLVGSLVFSETFSPRILCQHLGLLQASCGLI